MIKHKFNIFPEMDNEDYQRLLNDIDSNGFDKSQPVYLYENEILDGWNRQKACNELNIKPVYQNFVGSDIQAIEFVMRTNKRRNLNSGQWACIAVEAEEIVEAIKAEAKARMLAGKKDPEQLVAQGEKSSEKIAEMFNTNRQYINDAEKYKIEKPEIFEQIKSGEITMTQAKRDVKKAEVIERLENVEIQEAKKIEGVYDVIVIDPPWPMQKIERDCAPEQVAFEYPTMSIEEISELNIPCADNSHIFLWTTHKFLPDAFRLLKDWNMKYVCCFVWHKNGGFQPFGLPQYNCEFVLYARIGTPEFIDFKNFPTCFSANRGRHSEKPEEFYDILRRVTAGRRLDMFNRRKIDGFDVWGKEADYA